MGKGSICTCLVHEEAEVRLRERLLALDDAVQVRVQQLSWLDSGGLKVIGPVSYHDLTLPNPPKHAHTSITMYSSSAGGASPFAPGAGAPAVMSAPAAEGRPELSRRKRSLSVIMFWCWPRYLRSFERN